MRVLGKLPNFLIFSAFSLLLILLDWRGVLTPARSLAQTATLPLKTALSSARISFSLPFNFLGRGISDGKKNLALEEKVASLSAQISQEEALRQENEALRKLLGAPLSPSWKFTPARVVVRQNDAITVVGAPDVLLGTVAITPTDGGGVYVGKVQEVLGAEIKIILPNNPASKIPAYAKPTSGGVSARGIVVGRQNEAILDQVLTSENLAAGSLVATSGENAPPDLLIGEIEEVKTISGQAWQQAKLKPVLPADFDFVFLVTKY